MTRKLATIQTISELSSIPNSDRLEVASVLGWKCVVGKDEFKVGEGVVYIEADSILPEIEEFEFLREKCFVDNGVVRGFRIKTVKLRGQYSQGIVFPLSILNGKKYSKDTRENPQYEWSEGKEVTELLGIVQYQKPIPTYLSGKVKGTFPDFIPKSDETRVQILQELLNKYKGTKCYISEKIDGSSATYFLKDNEFGVCSRNLELASDDVSYHEKPKFITRTDGKYQKIDDKGELIGEVLNEPPQLPPISENVYWKMARKYDLENRLRSLGRNIAIQGEIYGPGLQGNPLKISDQKLAIFSIYDISQQRYLSLDEMRGVINQLNSDTGTPSESSNPSEIPVDVGVRDIGERPNHDIELVPILDENFELVADIDYLVSKATDFSKINTKCKREGIVIRPLEPIIDNNYSEECKAGRISFKVISPEYLIANDE